MARWPLARKRTGYLLWVCDLLSQTTKTADWPPTLRRIVRAAELECPAGHAEALRDLTTLALRQVPSRGIFDPSAKGEHELYTAIESVARAHLEMSDARGSLRSALDAAALIFGIKS